MPARLTIPWSNALLAPSFELRTRVSALHPYPRAGHCRKAKQNSNKNHRNYRYIFNIHRRLLYTSRNSDKYERTRRNMSPQRQASRRATPPRETSRCTSSTRWVGFHPRAGEDSPTAARTPLPPIRERWYRQFGYLAEVDQRQPFTVHAKNPRQLIEKQLADRLGLDPLEVRRHVDVGRLAFVDPLSIRSDRTQPDLKRGLRQEEQLLPALLIAAIRQHHAPDGTMGDVRRQPHLPLRYARANFETEDCGNCVDERGP